MVKQEDVADILNRVNEALRNTKYSAQGYDNTDTWLQIIIDEEEEEMSEYVKIKRRLYDELIETKAKYIVLCNMLESMTKVYEENKIKTESEGKE